MRRRVRTVVVAEFTIITLIDDPMVVGGRQLGNVALITVDAVEQCVERRTKIEAAPAAIADFINALRLFLELRRIDGIDQAQTIHVPIVSCEILRIQDRKTQRVSWDAQLTLVMSRREQN